MQYYRICIMCVLKTWMTVSYKKMKNEGAKQSDSTTWLFRFLFFFFLTIHSLSLTFKFFFLPQCAAIDLVSPLCNGINILLLKMSNNTIWQFFYRLLFMSESFK